MLWMLKIKSAWLGQRLGMLQWRLSSARKARTCHPWAVVRSEGHPLQNTGVFKGGSERAQGSVLGTFPDFTLNPH